MTMSHTASSSSSSSSTPATAASATGNPGITLVNSSMTKSTPTGGLLLRNVHYLEGESLSAKKGSLFISRSSGEITLDPDFSQKEGAVKGHEVSWLLDGAGDHDYLVIPALRNTVEIGIPQDMSRDQAAGFFTREELDSVKLAPN